MARFPSGVAVITTLDSAGQPRGLTTTAIISVSAEPPRLLISVDEASRTLRAIQESQSFVVNFLDAQHATIAGQFASKVKDKFAGIAWSPGLDGAPILHGHCCAWAECRVEREVTVGDHHLFIGDVMRGGVNDEDSHSLVYSRRRFGRWVELEG